MCRNVHALQVEIRRKGPTGVLVLKARRVACITTLCASFTPPHVCRWPTGGVCAMHVMCKLAGECTRHFLRRRDLIMAATANEGQDACTLLPRARARTTALLTCNDQRTPLTNAKDRSDRQRLACNVRDTLATGTRTHTHTHTHTHTQTNTQTRTHASKVRQRARLGETRRDSGPSLGVPLAHTLL